MGLCMTYSLGLEARAATTAMNCVRIASESKCERCWARSGVSFSSVWNLSAGSERRGAGSDG